MQEVLTNAHTRSRRLGAHIFTSAVEMLQTLCKSPEQLRALGGALHALGTGSGATTASLIAYLRHRRGDRYDYASVVFKAMSAPVTIICREHGAFQQAPWDHVAGLDCPECRGHNTKTFLDKARKAHGDACDYTDTVFSGWHRRIRYTCREHGPGLQLPDAHLAHGCPKCHAARKVLTKASFIEKSRLKHLNRYDYSRVEYVAARVPVEIVCTEHGSFYKGPLAHLAGSGCPGCRDQQAAAREAKAREAKARTTKASVATARAEVRFSKSQIRENRRAVARRRYAAELLEIERLSAERNGVCP